MTRQYTIEYRRAARRYLDRMSTEQRNRMIKALARLARDPAAPTSGARKLRNRPASRLRVGAYRIIFETDHDTRTILVVAIGPRGGVYRS